MHRNILTTKQIDLLPIIKELSTDYYLVDGTAIALHLRHRRSIDFDLFTDGPIKKHSIKRMFDLHRRNVEEILFEDSEQIHFLMNGVKVTFYSFPFKISADIDFEGIIKYRTC